MWRGFVVDFHPIGAVDLEVDQPRRDDVDVDHGVGRLPSDSGPRATRVSIRPPTRSFPVPGACQTGGGRERRRLLCPSWSSTPSDRQFCAQLPSAAVSAGSSTILPGISGQIDLQNRQGRVAEPCRTWSAIHRSSATGIGLCRIPADGQRPRRSRQLIGRVVRDPLATSIAGVCLFNHDWESLAISRLRGPGIDIRISWNAVPEGEVLSQSRAEREVAGTPPSASRAKASQHTDRAGRIRSLHRR